MISKSTPSTAGHALAASSSRNMTDEQLLLDYRTTGDEELFAQLVRRHRKPLLSYLTRYLGDDSMAEDAYQTTLLKVHQRCGQFQQGRAVRPWLYRIATNQAIDAIRRKRVRQMASLEAPRHSVGDKPCYTYRDILDDNRNGPLVQLEQKEHRDRVRRAVEKLPERLRQVVRLIFFRGLKYQEAADILSLPVGTVKSRMHSAMVNLRTIWTDSHPRHLELDY